MRDRTLQRIVRSIAWFLWALTIAFAVKQLWGLSPTVPEGWPARLMLAGTAWCCLLIARRGAPGLASASLVSLLVLFPDPWSLATGLVVLTAGQRWRSHRERRHPIHVLSACAVAWTLAYAVIASRLLPPIEPQWLDSVGRVVLVWSLFEGLSWALFLPMQSGRRSPSRLPEPAAWLNPAFALLIVILSDDAVTAGVLVAPLTIAGQWLLVRLSRTRRELARVRRALDSRLAEVQTLHSIGQELLSRPDDRRIGPLLDRECRKLFDPEGFQLWLEDDGVLRSVYRREGERRDSKPVAADPQLARWFHEEKRGLCWRVGKTEVPLRPLVRQARSALMAPFLVDQRVAGALIVESLRTDPYDEHQLAVLTTVAQQAAAALESAQQQRRATIDSLTGFFLRDYFFRRLDEEQRRAGRYGGGFALLMIDLDAFKAVNDRHGHLAGDRYLRAVAGAVRGQLRGADMPCRYGGDEFALLLPETDLPGACTIAERIREAVARLEVQAEGASLRSTVSIGLAVYPEHGADDAKGLMRHADEALYRAKRAGRDRVVPYAA